MKVSLCLWAYLSLFISVALKCSSKITDSVRFPPHMPLCGYSWQSTQGVEFFCCSPCRSLPRGLYYPDNPPNLGDGVFAKLAVWCLCNMWAAGGGWHGCASPWLCGPLQLCLTRGRAALFRTWCLLCFSLLKFWGFDFWEPHQTSKRNSVKTTWFHLLS